MAQAVAEELSADELVNKVTDLLQNGVTLKDINGYTDEEMEAVYALAYNKYNQAKYEEAMHLFGYLLMHDQLERRYYKAFGSCLQMLKKYPEAIRNFSMASVFDLTDPEPTFHTAECMVGMGMVGEACEALEIVVRQTKKRDEYSAMHARAEAMLQILATQVKGAPK